jgi:hypothetical protein
MSPSRSVLKSSLDLWDAIDKLREASHSLLPPQDSARVDSVLAKSARDTLELLEGESSEDASESSEDSPPEDSEVNTLRSCLRKIAGS